MTEKEKGDRQLAWIYEGTKSLVNREDYLLGKRVDKNFELYSDAVVKEKESGIEAVEKPKRHINDTSSSKTSNLGVDIVRTEDPLVAIKVMREERVWQEKMENPLVQLRMQKLMKKVMEKREKKRLKKLKKLEKKEKKFKHSADISEDVEHTEKTERKFDGEKCAATSSLSPEIKLAKGKRKEHLQRDTHIPEHLRPKYDSTSESDDSQDESKEAYKKAKTEYGLVKSKEKARSKEEVVSPYKNLPKKHQAEPYKRSERRQLTEEEMEKKRTEMLENANWRDEVRKKNIRRNTERDEEESRRNEGKTANFIRPMLNNAASTMTVEQQLKSHRGGLQRTIGFAEGQHDP
uniref:Pre-mRNA-splicing factor CWC25-like protein n=1 Tax=Setaria digitata TaxID=48799 RepID=A0A915PSQ8_9BILA